MNARQDARGGMFKKHSLCICPEGVILCVKTIPLEVTALVARNIITNATNVPWRSVSTGKVRSSSTECSKALRKRIRGQSALGCTAVPIIRPLVDDYTSQGAVIVPRITAVMVEISTRKPWSNQHHKPLWPSGLEVL